MPAFSPELAQNYTCHFIINTVVFLIFSSSSSMHFRKALATVLFIGCLQGMTFSLKAEPPQEIARRVLVIFGADPEETGSRKVWPPDTVTAQHLQVALEWSGYEVEFHDIQKPLPKLPLAKSYAAVIFDGNMKIPHVLAPEFTDWAIALLPSKIKVLWLGAIPLDTPELRRRVLDAYGWGGSGRTLTRPESSKIISRDELVMKSEVPLTPSKLEHYDITAPAGSDIFLSLEAKTEISDNTRFDAAFRAPWGAALFDPYMSKQYSPNHVLQLFDPFVFVERVLPIEAFPIPDSTTRLGQRELICHIDGDGFNSMSNVTPGSINAEVICEKVLKAYPYLPTTVSVIEATTRGLEAGDDPAKRTRYEEVARAIFALPNVQAASHTYSHPFRWMSQDEDRLRLRKAPLNLNLRADADPGALTAEREVNGSINYVSHLLPKGQRVELLLWSGNCRPGPESLASARTSGVEAMNGGNTIISKRWHGNASIAPRTTMMGDELQVYAPAQNEMFYTDDWRSSSLGGFANVIETYKLTGAPRRLKPVNIYYHFYSGERGDAFAALLKVYNWAVNEPLHVITALDYVRTVRDARDAIVTQIEPRTWTIACRGSLQEFRVPINMGYPVVGGSSGVTGWNDEGPWRYIHTNGSKQISLHLQDQPDAHPSVTTSTEPLSVIKQDPNLLTIRCAARRNGKVSLRLPGGEKAWKIQGQKKAESPETRSSTALVTTWGTDSTMNVIVDPELEMLTASLLQLNEH